MQDEKSLSEKIELPVYQAPEVITFTDEEILEELGPAQAVYGCADPTGQFC